MSGLDFDKAPWWFRVLMYVWFYCDKAWCCVKQVFKRGGGR